MNHQLQKEIFYEIYPNSFMDSDGDGYGDFQGIIDRLDYVKELGVTAIWLNPHYVSSWKDGGYDVVDHYHADERFGGDAGFEKLLQEVHKRGLKLIIDLVVGHTSEDNPLFLQSASTQKSAYDDLFIWTDNVWNAPKEYALMRGRFDRDGAYMVNFFCTQPAFNYGFSHITHPEWQMSYKDERTFQARDLIVDICLHYLKIGVDGFRVDMADSLVKNDPDREATIEVWHYIFAKVRAQFPRAIFVSEWTDPDRSLAAGFDMDFMNDRENTFANDLARRELWDKQNISFLLPDSKLDISENLQKTVELIRRNREKGYLSFISCNHDTARPTRFLHGRALRLFYIVLFTLPGVPFLYYGDEIAMQYQKDIPSKECGFARTGSRTVMNWTEGKNHGFSSAAEDKLFLPIDPTTSVEKMRSDQSSLYWLVKALIALRKQETMLHGNMIETVPQRDKRLLVYKRGNLTIAVNPACTEKTVEGRFDRVLFSDGDVRLCDSGIVLSAQSACVVR